jgi:hypothetical protein
MLEAITEYYAEAGILVSAYIYNDNYIFNFHNDRIEIQVRRDFVGDLLDELNRLYLIEIGILKF